MADGWGLGAQSEAPPGSAIQFNRAAQTQTADQREDPGAILVGKLGEMADQLARIVWQIAGHGETMSKPHAGELPFPESLCHRCAAPPRYVRTDTSVFILCPIVPEKYPRQPVRECPWFRPRPES